MKFVSERVRPKLRGDTIITGPPLAGFTKAFSENVNNNIVPKISSLWQVINKSILVFHCSHHIILHILMHHSSVFADCRGIRRSQVP